MGKIKRIALITIIMLSSTFTGCGMTKISLREFTFQEPLRGGGVYYAEVSGKFPNVPAMGAILYKNEKPDAFGREVVVIANGVSSNLWQKMLPALVHAGGFVGGAAVYGLSLDAAKTVVNTAVTTSGSSATGGSATGGEGGNATATGGNTSVIGDTGPNSNIDVNQ